MTSRLKVCEEGSRNIVGIYYRTFLVASERSELRGVIGSEARSRTGMKSSGCSIDLAYFGVMGPSAVGVQYLCREAQAYFSESPA